MKLGPVTVADAAELAAIHAEAFETPWNAAAFAALLESPGVAGLAEAGGAGLILWRRVLDEAEVLTLAVRPEARRQGLARGLVEAALGLAAQSGARRAFLEVACDNAGALALYAACGFAPVGTRPGYYRRADGPAVDARLLARDLNSAFPSPYPLPASE